MSGSRHNWRSIARQKVLESPGHLYAARSAGGQWIKVGFSLDVPERIRALNYAFPDLAPFKLLGSTPSIYRAERHVHWVLEPFRRNHVGLSREIYPATIGLIRIVSVIIEGVDRPLLSLDERIEARRWCFRAAQHESHDEPIRTAYRQARLCGYRELEAA